MSTTTINNTPPMIAAGFDLRGMSPSEALEGSGLADWNQHLVPILASEVTDLGAFQEYETDLLAIVGHVEGYPRVLGTTLGKRYVPIQNEAVFTPATYIAGERGMAPFAGGSRKKGRLSYMAFDLPEGVTSVGGDEIMRQLVIQKSNDGQGGVLATLSATRLSCSNQLPMLRRSSNVVLRIRHSLNADPFVAQAVEKILGLSEAWSENFDKSVKELMDQPVTKNDYWDIVKRITGPLPEAKDEPRGTRAQSVWVNRVIGLQDAWRYPSLEGVGDNAWKALNAISEYEQHGSGRADRIARANALLDGRQPLTTKALAVLV